MNEFPVDKLQSDKLVKIKIEKLNKFGLGSVQRYFPDHGLCYIDIPYTLPGEVSLIKINKNKSKRFLGTLVKSQTHSPNRIDPNCVHFKKCGGCLIQHLDFEKYLNWKFELILSPISEISPQTEFKEILFAKTFSRRRAKVFVKKKDNLFFIGFKKFKSNDITDISNCIILEPEILKVVKSLEKYLNKVLKNGDNLTLHFNKIDAGVDILIETKNELNYQQLNFFRNWAKHNEIVRISKKNKNDYELIALYDKLSLSLPNSNLYILPPPGGFFQATKFAEEIMVKSILNYLNSHKKYKILELFCGSGTFTIPLLKNKHKLYSIDLDESSINNLIKACKIQGLYNNLKTSIVNLFKNPVTNTFLDIFDIVIIDPPRMGAKNQFLKIAESKVKKVISISCNIKTFTSDAKILLDSGFKLKTLIPIDQFLYTSHLEIIAFFER